MSLHEALTADNPDRLAAWMNAGSAPDLNAVLRECWEEQAPNCLAYLASAGLRDRITRADLRYRVRSPRMLRYFREELYPDLTLEEVARAMAFGNQRDLLEDTVKGLNWEPAREAEWAELWPKLMEEAIAGDAEGTVCTLMNWRPAGMSFEALDVLARLRKIGGFKQSVVTLLLQNRSITSEQFWSYVEDYWDELKWSRNRRARRYLCDDTCSDD
jgi:hypothetical protein